MTFMNPIWLWGLSGLLIPIAIHLLSRKEGKTIYIGSLRHLRASDSAQFSSIRLNEILLLLLRSLLIILIVLLLSGLSLSSPENKKNKWLVVEKGIDRDAVIAPMLDSLRSQNYELHYLTHGFPQTGDSIQQGRPIDYWSLAEELESRDLDDIVVISYNFLKNFRGKRAPQSERVHWIVKDSQERKFLAAIIPVTRDSAWVRMASSNASLTSFETKTMSLDAIDKTATKIQSDTVLITIVSDKAYDYDKKILLASLTAIQSASPFSFRIAEQSVNEKLPTKTDWIFWLSSQVPRQVLHFKSVGFSECNNTQKLLQPAAEVKYTCATAQYFSWIITQRLNEESVLEENFVQDLGILLMKDFDFELKDDQRSLPESEMWSSEKVAGHTTVAAPGRTMDSFLMFSILILLIAERIIAYKRKQ